MDTIGVGLGAVSASQKLRSSQSKAISRLDIYAVHLMFTIIEWT